MSRNPAVILGLSVAVLGGAADGNASTQAQAVEVSASNPHRGATAGHLASARPAQPAAQRQLTITVLWDDAMSTRESGLWIGYLFARMEFVSRNGGRYNRVPGVITPIFDEEVFARGEAAKIYRELRSQGKGTDSPYFNDLAKVDAAGFMREYVWQYFHRDGWDAPADQLRSNEFERWARSNLNGHKPETRGRVAFQVGSTEGT